MLLLFWPGQLPLVTHCLLTAATASTKDRPDTPVAVQMSRTYSSSMAQENDALPRPSLVLQLQRQVQHLEEEKQSALEQCMALEGEQSTLLCEVCFREAQAQALAVSLHPAA